MNPLANFLYYKRIIVVQPGADETNNWKERKITLTSMITTGWWWGGGFINGGEEGRLITDLPATQYPNVRVIMKYRLVSFFTKSVLERHLVL